MKTLQEMTKKELYTIAKERNIKNRSKMDKNQLIEALQIPKKSSLDIAKDFAKAKRKNTSNRKAFLSLNLQYFASNLEIEFYNKNYDEKVKEAIESHIRNEFNTSHEFIVLDDENKEEYLLESQKNMLWAFNPDFIIKYVNSEHMEAWEYRELSKSLGDMQERLCESANGIIKALTDWKEMILDGAEIDGYGHLLNNYDGNEYEFDFKGKTYYIYLA